MPFSIVIIGKNEALNLERTLPALQGLSDDILLVDTNSTDHTPALCAQYGVRLLQHEWLGYSKTKNWGNAQAKYDWILSIDADEVVSPQLFSSLREIIVQPKTVYLLDRISSVGDRWIKHAGWYPDWKPRLFDRRVVHWEGDYVHETLVVPRDFEEVRLAGKFYHYSYHDTYDLRERSFKYAQLSAQKLLETQKPVPFYKPWLSPSFRFIRTLVLKSAWRDGTIGWFIAWNNARMVREKYRHYQFLKRQARG